MKLTFHYYRLACALEPEPVYGYIRWACSIWRYQRTIGARLMGFGITLTRGASRNEQ